jgi:DNA-binding NarL/FixJ family response regulator
MRMLELTLLIADDHPLFRAALREAVGRHVPGARIIEASSLDTLQRAVAEYPDADLILLDLRMPGAKGFSSLLYLRAEHPTVPVIVVSAAEDPSVVQRALDFGASGFIPKSARIETIGESLRIVLGGGVFAPPMPERVAKVELQDRDLARRLSTLTPQQLKVLVMLADGQSNKYIAGSLAITEATVKAHITGILRKLGIERRTQAAVMAQRLLQTGDRADVTELEGES